MGIVEITKAVCTWLEGPGFFCLPHEGGRDLMKVYTFREVSGVPFYHIVMSLPSN